MFIGMDPPKHDRLKMLFQRGFTPKRIADHEERSARSRASVLDRLDGPRDLRPRREVAQPFVARVIGSFMGIPPEDDADLGAADELDARRRRPRHEPGGRRVVMERDVPEIFERCGKLIAERRENPTDDLTSVLVHAEVDGQTLEEHEIVMGFFLLVAAGNDSTKATYCSAMRALMEDPERAPEAARRPVADPERGRGGAADVPRLRPLRAAPRRATPSSTGSRSGEGEKVVMWYVSSNRDEDALRGPRPLRRDRNPEHQASAPAAATSASAPRWRGSS